jgi:DNA-binding NarL/FixJ family response regulator
VEIESGKRNDRPKLAEALRLCRPHGAVLIIAKLDRLSLRDVAMALAANGYISKSGKPFGAAAIARMVAASVSGPGAPALHPQASYR